MEALQNKYRMLNGHLDECSLRLCLGADALYFGRGGTSAVAQAAGVSRTTTVHVGIKALREDASKAVTQWLLLDALGYSMQSNRKTHEGADHPDRGVRKPGIIQP